jgi:hypothetical protein
MILGDIVSGCVAALLVGLLLLILRLMGIK